MSKLPPCNKCICVAVCRHKRYRDLYMQCQLLKDYLVDSVFKDDKQFVFGCIQDILKPTKWDTTCSGNVVTEQGYIMRDMYD